jgi:hypothetical protein
VFQHAHPEFAHRKYRPDVPAFAVRDFEYGPRSFVKGEAFPWRELGLSQDQLRHLWMACLVNTPELEAPVADLVEPLKVKPKFKERR